MLDFVKNLACSAGKLAQEERKDFRKESISFKGTRDLVTLADKRVEAFIVAKIRERFPEHIIIGEEGGKSGSQDEHCWVIDPIDGTTSYCHDLPGYTVSIGYSFAGKTELGVVFAPEFNQLFWAKSGDGAWMNEKRLSVSGATALIDSVLATGFTCMRDNGSRSNIPLFNKILPHIRDFRRMGSAALDLAYVAAGKLDGYWELNLNNYDVVAGALLVKEAGGVVTDFSGGNKYPEKGIVACSSGISAPLIAFLKE